jgi:hypothetical protein
MNYDKKLITMAVQFACGGWVLGLLVGSGDQKRGLLLAGLAMLVAGSIYVWSFWK